MLFVFLCALALLVCIYKEAETVKEREKDQIKQSEELSEVIIQGNGFSYVTTSFLHV